MLLQKKIEQMTDLIKRLKLCVRWFKRIEEGYVQEKEKLRFELEAAEKKCTDTGAFSLFWRFFRITWVDTLICY